MPDTRRADRRSIYVDDLESILTGILGKHIYNFVTYAPMEVTGLRLHTNFQFVYRIYHDTVRITEIDDIVEKTGETMRLGIRKQQQQRKHYLIVLEEHREEQEKSSSEGLKQLLLPYCKMVELKRFDMSRAGIDGQNWLHDAAFTCCRDLALGRHKLKEKHIRKATHYDKIRKRLRDESEYKNGLQKASEMVHGVIKAYLSTHLSKRLNSFCYDNDDDEDYTSVIIPNEPVLSTEEPDNSLSMGDEHLDTILVTKSDEFIKSSVENLIPILSESEGIPKKMCDMPFNDNSPPVDASHPNSKLVSSEVMEIVISEVGWIDDDILLTIKDDILREKLLNVNLLVAKIEALNANPNPSFDCMTKSSSTSLNSLLEETNTFDNSLPAFETLCFDISSDSPTTHSDSPLYESFIFDLLINPFPPAERSDFDKFTVELIPIISPPAYDCFLFKVKPNWRDFTKDVVEDISLTKELQVHIALPTYPTLQLNLKFQPSS
nr:hypothetical protein [Tanacetum cinerariifolium]